MSKRYLAFSLLTVFVLLVEDPSNRLAGEHGHARSVSRKGREVMKTPSIAANFP